MHVFILKCMEKLHFGLCLDLQPHYKISFDSVLGPHRPHLWVFLRTFLPEPSPRGSPVDPRGPGPGTVGPVLEPLSWEPNPNAKTKS